MSRSRKPTTAAKPAAKPDPEQILAGVLAWWSSAYATIEALADDVFRLRRAAERGELAGAMSADAAARLEAGLQNLGTLFANSVPRPVRPVRWPPGGPPAAGKDD